MGNTFKLKMTGLDEWQGAIRSMQSRIPDALTAAFDRAADVVVDGARPLMPRRSGRAAGSIEAKSSSRGVAITAGGSTAPYYAWLEFGGRVGRKKATKRRFISEGRYIFPTFRNKREEVNRVLVASLRELAESEGLRVI